MDQVHHNNTRPEVVSATSPAPVGSGSGQLTTESYSTVFSNISSSLSSTLRWRPTSEQQLEQAEADLLATIKKPFKTYFVNIGQGWGRESNFIRTLETISGEEASQSENNVVENKLARPPATKCPILLLHGFASGIGNWILNYDPLASTLGRKIYAIDLIGFGRSSRAPFDLTADVEGQFVESLERWRQEKGVEKFILLGHSFGGYLSASYALKYPHRVAHLILADPWGVQDRKTAPNRIYKFPIWVRVANSLFQSMNPLAVLRVTGPYGPKLVQKFRGDLREKFRPLLQDDCGKFLDYIYHCNAQSATGESAFKALVLPFGWPKNPLIHRLVLLDESVKMTFIYGSRSWIEKAPGEYLREVLTPERVTVNVLQGAGHHVYADKYMEFNELVQETCKRVQD